MLWFKSRASRPSLTAICGRNGNSRTSALTLEVNVPPEGNSGVYLRGIYEVQVLDSYGKPWILTTWARSTAASLPARPPEKPAGQWQTLDITLVDRHVTVILNGKKIIDNQPLLGCTGGALWSDQFRPGPIICRATTRA